MNGRQFSFGSSGGLLAQIVALAVFGVAAVFAVVMGAFVLVALLILGMVGLVVLSVRGWWLRRKLRGRFGGGEPPPSRQARGQRLIEAEYVVVETESDEERRRRERGQR